MSLQTTVFGHQGARVRRNVLVRASAYRPEGMDVNALLIGIVSGGTIGAVVTAFVTTTHERDERFRERALEAASAFLAARERALAALTDVQGKARVAQSAVEVARPRVERFVEMSKPLVEAARDLPRQAEREPRSAAADNPLTRTLRALYAVYDVIKGRQVGAENVALVREALSDIEATLPALAAMPEPWGGYGKRLREVLSDLRLTLATDDALERAMEASATATNALQEHAAMVQLLFAADGPVVVSAADSVIEGLSEATRAVLTDALSGRGGFDNEDVKSLLADEARATEDFAVAVSHRVRSTGAWRRGARRASGRL